MRITGKYYRTIYHDEATGDTFFYFTVVDDVSEAKADMENGILKCQGKITLLASGIPLQIEGTLQNHRFHVTSYSFLENTPAMFTMMLQYLTDNELTEAQERKLLELCNNDILYMVKQPEVIDKALCKSKAKDKVKKQLLSKIKALCEQESMTRILIRYGIELNKIEMLYKHSITYEQFKKNPYLSCVYHAISIYQADQFAFDECNILPYATIRLCGFLLDAVFRYRESGHCCVKLTTLCNYVNSRLKRSIFPQTKVNIAILQYCVHLLDNHLELHVLQNEVYVYEKVIWEEETQIITHIRRLNNEKKEMVRNPKISQIERELGITYNQKQKESFRLLQTSGVKILTGPPGSGKTATLRGLIRALELAYPDQKVIVKLSATTGRAAQVMSNSSGRTAETINKMLNIVPYGEKVHGKNQNDPVEADLIIADEISMLGVKMASCLFSAIKTGSILLLVGDENQLQSVEYGNVLQDVIASGCIEVCKLTEIMRQSGAICDNAVKVNNGKHDLIEDPSFHVHHCTEENTKKALFSFMQKENFQVVSSVKKGSLGIYALNKEIQKRKNLRKKICLIYKGLLFYENDPVIMTKTNYDKGYFNGDIGKIIGSDEEGVIVEFPKQILHLGKEEYHDMELAYAITTHRCQGSEFDHVHILLPRHPDNMLTRRILYTAITRAKKDIHLYVVDDACDYAIDNTAERPRISLLKDRLLLS